MDPLTLISLAIGAAGAFAGGNKKLFGENEKTSSTYNKGQLSHIDEILNSLKGMKGAQDITQQPGYQQGNDWLMSMFNDPGFFKNIEAPAMRQFEEEIIPGIANRFGGMGSHGGLRSTAFQNSLGRAGTDLATNLSAQRGQMQERAIPQLLNYAQQPFSNYSTLTQQALQPTQNVHQGPSSGILGGMTPQIISAMLSKFIGGGQ